MVTGHMSVTASPCWKRACCAGVGGLGPYCGGGAGRLWRGAKGDRGTRGMRARWAKRVAREKENVPKRLIEL